MIKSIRMRKFLIAIIAFCSILSLSVSAQTPNTTSRSQASRNAEARQRIANSKVKSDSKRKIKVHKPDRKSVV